MHRAKAMRGGIRVNPDESAIPMARRVMHVFLKIDFLGKELCGVSPRTLSYFFVSHTKK